jgi:hypothetical protein
MAEIVANRRPAVGFMLHRRRHRSVRITTLAPTRQLRDTCPRTNSRKNPRPGRRCFPSRRARSSSAIRPASASTSASGAPTSPAASPTRRCSPT